MLWKQLLLTTVPKEAEDGTSSEVDPEAAASSTANEVGDEAAGEGEAAETGAETGASLLGEGSGPEGKGEGEGEAAAEDGSGAEEGAFEKWEVDSLPAETFGEDGLTEEMRADPLLGEFVELANEQELKPEQASAFIGLYQKAQEQIATASQEAWAEVHEGWLADLKADPDLGGKDFDTNVGKITEVVGQFAVPGFFEAMKYTSAGQHPAVVKTLWNMVQPLSEGGYTKGASVEEPAEKSLAEVMYPNMPTGKQP